MTKSGPADQETFLRRVRQGLGSLAPAEQEDIVAELRSHLLDRQKQGHEDPLAGFETPEDLAADFVSEHALRGALAQGTPWALGTALLIAARDSMVALSVLLPLLVFQLAGLSFLVVAALKPFMTDNLGVWMGGGNFVIGTRPANPAAHEILGWWAIPVLTITGVLLFWFCNRAMMTLVRWRLRSGKPWRR
jgi:uncharacterized membrane protein